MRLQVAGTGNHLIYHCTSSSKLWGVFEFLSSAVTHNDCCKPMFDRHTQFPVQCRLALFRNHKGWGVMTLDRIERGNYVCTYRFVRPRYHIYLGLIAHPNNFSNSGDIIRDDKAAREVAP